MLLTLLLVAHCAVANAADTPLATATVRCDAAHPKGGAFDRLTASTIGPWEEWLGSNSLIPAYPVVVPERVVDAVCWTNVRDRSGVEVGNMGASALRVRIETRLSGGLWRADAALLSGVYVDGVVARALVSPPSLWRMDSVLLRDEGIAVKTITLHPGQVLFLKWTETVADADRARQAARRACWKSSNGTMQNRVSPALEQVGDTLDVLPDVVERGERDKVVKRIHTALLAVAKAQAVWQNWREEEASDGDSAFDALIRALSEISCAACGLTPSQTAVIGDDGRVMGIRLSVSNGGARTIPLLSLGLARRADGIPSPDRTVFRAVPPGGSVTASFPVKAADTALESAGVMQFIFGMGTAVVPTRPEGPP